MAPPAPTLDRPTRPTPELLYLLHGDPAELEAAIAGMRAADLADALLSLNVDAGAKVVAALPFDLAVQALDEPELAHRRSEIVKRMPEGAAGPLIDAMSSDQQAALFRDLPADERVRFLGLLDEPTRQALTLLLKY